MFVIVSVCFLCVMCSVPVRAVADPPQDIKIQFVPATSTLKIDVLHASKAPKTKHYIKQVSVSLNGQQVILQSFRQQTDNKGQHVEYILLDAGTGSRIQVTATCSIFGSLTREIVAGK